MFPSFSFDESNALSVMRRLYVAKHDPEDYVRELADKCVFQLKPPSCIVCDVIFDLLESGSRAITRSSCHSAVC